MPLQILSGVNDKLRRKEIKRHIEKIEKIDEGCFISSIIITRKKDGSIKLSLDSKLLIDKILKTNTRYRTYTNLKIMLHLKIKTYRSCSVILISKTSNANSNYSRKQH